MPPRAARPLSRSQLAFESLLEREDDGQDPVQLPPRGQRNPKKKKATDNPHQAELFGYPPDELFKNLDQTDPNSLTPLEALNLL